MNRTIAMNDALYDYLLSVSSREAPIFARLRAETSKLEWSQMQIGPDQGQFMSFLVRLIGARRTIEVGVFTGYSSLAVALALPDDGRIVACDVSEEWTAIARRYWKEAGVAHKIDLRLRPAAETLDELLGGGEAGRFDLAFIDADKKNYDAYVERCLKLVRPGGLILIDNVLWGGNVINREKQDEDTVAIRALNAKLHTDERVDLAMIPVGDGLTLLRRR
jgi:caffeoyl-CoA O-methyltransferase